MNKLLLFILLIGFSLSGISQDDSAKVVEHKNIIRWNMTPMLVLGPKSLVLGYQRTINSKQSFSINAGYLETKPLTREDGTVIKVFDHSKRSGFDLAIDYRFYFHNRNKYIAPDGLYWGPYAAWYNLNFEGVSEIEEGGVPNRIGIETHINILSLGVQLGYQFIIKKRFSIDLMLVGPSYTRYGLDMTFESSAALDPNSDFYNDYKAILSRLIPGSEVILDGIEFNQNGRIRIHSYGFRYGIQLGYAF